MSSHLSVGHNTGPHKTQYMLANVNTKFKSFHNSSEWLPNTDMEFRKSGAVTVRVGSRKSDNRGFTMLLISLLTKRIREMGHVARMGKKNINANCLLDSKYQGRRPLRRLSGEVQGSSGRIILNLILKHVILSTVY